MHDVITFGSAAQDIYIKSKKFVVAGRNICVPIGSKTEAEDVLFFSGGGGTNTAATFVKQGLKTAYCGMVGKDIFGDSTVRELKKLGIDTALVKKAKDKSTNVSILMAYPGKDRTILVYRGASDLLTKRDIPWAKIKNARWFYLAPLAGRAANLTGELVDFAQKNRIKVAFNPGYGQLTLPRPVLERILAKVDVLILNKKEASLLRAGKITRGITVITNGKHGAAVFEGKYIYQAKSLDLKAVDTNGAGDSFGAGFISGLIETGDTAYAMQLAMANSGYNLTKWGAKEGLLAGGQKWPRVKVDQKRIKDYIKELRICLV